MPRPLSVAEQQLGKDLDVADAACSAAKGAWHSEGQHVEMTEPAIIVIIIVIVIIITIIIQ